MLTVTLTQNVGSGTIPFYKWEKSSHNQDELFNITKLTEVDDELQPRSMGPMSMVLPTISPPHIFLFILFGLLLSSFTSPSTFQL